MWAQVQLPFISIQRELSYSVCTHPRAQLHALTTARTSKILSTGINTTVLGSLKCSMDFTRLGSSADGLDHTVQNQPGFDLIWFWLAVSGFGQTGLVQKQASVLLG